jgi:fructose-bisphosphate aldolase class II
LAVAVGNAHGDYRFPPRLDFDRIAAISNKTGIPLVLHGGSGLSDDDFKRAVKAGISKINIFTDIDKAGKKGVEKALRDGITSMTGIIPYEIEAISSVVKEKIELFSL